jgi:hypothetical protein
MHEEILNWFGNGRVGSSSKAMALAIAGVPCEDKSHPNDPSDFNRCLLFLQAVPEARNYLGKVAELSPYWKAIIDNFSEIEKSLIEEVGPNWTKDDRAPKTYELMRSILVPIWVEDTGSERVVYCRNIRNSAMTGKYSWSKKGSTNETRNSMQARAKGDY